MALLKQSHFKQVTRSLDDDDAAVAADKRLMPRRDSVRKDSSRRLTVQASSGTLLHPMETEEARAWQLIVSERLLRAGAEDPWPSTLVRLSKDHEAAFAQTAMECAGEQVRAQPPPPVEQTPTHQLRRPCPCCEVAGAQRTCVLWLTLMRVVLMVVLATRAPIAPGTQPLLQRLRGALQRDAHRRQGLDGLRWLCFARGTFQRDHQQGWRKDFSVRS